MITGTPKQLIPALLELDQEKIYELKEKKQKRSLNSNAYAWVLITKIGDVLNKSKEELYFQFLKEYGQVTSIMLSDEINIGGFVKYYELESKRLVNNRIFKIYRVYKGSSEFDTKEMSTFIDGIVYEAKNLGIEVLTPDELTNLKNQWGEDNV